MVTVAEADFVGCVTEVAVMVTVLLVGTATGAEKSVATPLPELEALRVPQAPALPQVTVQLTPAFEESFATNAVNAAPLETWSEVGNGLRETLTAVFVRLKLAGADAPGAEALTV
jgi:hypothetical protein